MHMQRVPANLRARLGQDATDGLVDLLNDAGKEWAAAVTASSSDRFERRLVEETSALRVEMANGFAGARQELAEGLAAVRQEMANGFAGARQELAQGLADVRQEMAVIRQDMARDRVELLKWAFLFWMGQFFAMGSLVAVLIRFLRPGG